MLLGGGFTSAIAKFTGLSGVSLNIFKGVGAGAMDLFEQGVSKGSFNVSTFDYANALSKGLSVGLMEQFGGLKYKIFGVRRIGTFGSDILSSIIDLKYKNGLHLDFRFNSKSAVEFGYRSLFGIQFDKYKIGNGYSVFMNRVGNKVVRGTAQDETNELINGE